MEIDDETIKMRIFPQSLGGEVKKWFKNLPTGSIQDLPALYRTFADKWETRENPRQLLAEYISLKRNVGESVHDYTMRFNSIYNALPPHMKPPLGMVPVSYTHL